MFANYRECVWARRAYNLEYGNCPRRFGDHFRKGFEEGYCSICNGGDGYVPAMPPRDYWGYEFQSQEGSECVSAWFDGYPAGVAAAKKHGAGKNSDAYISKMIEAAVQQDKNGVRLASDVKIKTKGDAGATESTPESSLPASPAEESNTPPVPLEPTDSSMVIGRGHF